MKAMAAPLVLFCVSTFVVPGWAGERPRHGPPPEAFEVCANQAEGAACSIVGRRGEELPGQCLYPPQSGDQLVCAPDKHRLRGSERNRADQLEEQDS